MLTVWLLGSLTVMKLVVEIRRQLWTGGYLRYALTVFTEVAQFVIEFVTSAEVGGFAGDSFLGVAAATAGAAAAALVVLIVAANEVPARSKTMNVNDFILAR
jgi:hypothetical protein